MYIRLLFLILFFSFENSVSSQNKHPEDKEQLIRIPVVFHVVYPHDFYKKKIDRTLLKDIVDKINNNFNNVNPLFINKPYDILVAKCKIEFFIPNKGFAITYHYSDRIFKKAFSFSKNPKYDKELKEKGYVDSRHFLNIWICSLNDKPLINNISFKDEVPSGYSSFPDVNNPKNDGIVLDNELFYYFDTTENKRIHVHPNLTANIITHEIGHWLGLYHIWGKYDYGCIGDDGIIDTPNQSGKNRFDFFGEFSDQMLMTCDGNQLSNYQNFMDYTYSKHSMFTKGQKNKMRYNIFKYRHELTENSTLTTGIKKIVINNQYSHVLEYRLTSLNRYQYKKVFRSNSKLVQPGRYLFEIFDKTSRTQLASNTITIQNTKKGIIVFIDRNGCTKWQYIDEPTKYDFSFNINKMENKCVGNTRTYNRTDYYQQRKRRSSYSKRRSSSSKNRKKTGNKSYDDAYKRADKMYKDGMKRANDMYNRARKKYR